MKVILIITFNLYWHLSCLKTWRWPRNYSELVWTTKYEGWQNSIIILHVIFGELLRKLLVKAFQLWPTEVKTWSLMRCIQFEFNFEQNEAKFQDICYETGYVCEVEHAVPLLLLHKQKIMDFSLLLLLWWSLNWLFQRFRNATISHITQSCSVLFLCGNKNAAIRIISIKITSRELHTS